MSPDFALIPNSPTMLSAAELYYLDAVETG